MSDLRDETGVLVCDFKLKELQLSKTLELYKFSGVACDILLAIVGFSSIGAWALWDAGYKWLWATILFIVQCITIGKPYLHTETTIACLDEKSKSAKLLTAEAKALYRRLNDMPDDNYTQEQKDEFDELEKKGIQLFDFDSHVFVFHFFNYPNKWAQEEMRSWAKTTLKFKF